MEGIKEWVDTFENDGLHSLPIQCNFQEDAEISGKLCGGGFMLLAFRRPGGFAGILAIGYFSNSRVLYANIVDGNWVDRFISVM